MLPYAPSSVAMARQRLSADLVSSGVFESVVDDAAIVVSELFSNALRHARPLSSGFLRVTWHRYGDFIEVAVSDGGSATQPHRGLPSLSSLGGRGLCIVESLTSRWGVRHEGDATTVWAALCLLQTSGYPESMVTSEAYSRQ